MIDAIYPSLAGQHVLVTGGGTGIGATLVEAFADQGARVSFLDIADEPAKALAERLKDRRHAPHYRHCDLTDLDALTSTLDEVQDDFGPVQVLINNAANDARHRIDELTLAQWDASLQVNLRHLLFCARSVLPGMKTAGGGVILNLGSISWHRALPDLTLYMTAKAGIEGFSRGLARDFGPHNIRVNTIVPGAVRTSRQTMLWHTPDEEAKILAGQCLKTRVEPEDVAALSLFLASADATRCTGREYFVDAGWWGA